MEGDRGKKGKVEIMPFILFQAIRQMERKKGKRKTPCV